MSKKITSIKRYLSQKELPLYEDLFNQLDEVSNVLENEDVIYRPLNSNNERGSLLDLKEDIPIIIVPDIHSRPDFILNILDYELPFDFLKNKTKICDVGEFENQKNLPQKMKIGNLLEKELVYLVCVGDAIHSELTPKRWASIEDEFYSGIYDGPVMQEEMVAGFAVLCGIMELKRAFPKNFHFLKGNHENILNSSENGDYAFKKYADEGEMVKKFVQTVYGDDILYLISYFEANLPLVVKGKKCVISHAEPALELSKKDIINARLNPSIVESLIWTKNDTVFDNTVEKNLVNLLGKRKAKKALYFAGHRPIKNNFALRQEGKFVQLHNPKKQNVALVSSIVDFDLENDIVSVDLSGGK